MRFLVGTGVLPDIGKSLILHRLVAEIVEQEWWLADRRFAEVPTGTFQRLPYLACFGLHAMPLMLGRGSQRESSLSNV